jgi:hypothetical protein
MVRRILLVSVLLAAAVLLFLFTPSGEVVSQAIRQVFVTNFPEVQRVAGTVEVLEPVALAELVKFENITVPPVKRDDTTRLVEAGVLEAEGFPEVVLSLHGVVKGHVGRTGTVGALLIPDEESIQEAFFEQGMLHFFLETSATKTPYFASNQPQYTVAFARYRIFLYNTTDKTIAANLFVYLTN